MTVINDELTCEEVMCNQVLDLQDMGLSLKCGEM